MKNKTATFTRNFFSQKTIRMTRNTLFRATRKSFIFIFIISGIHSANAQWSDTPGLPIAYWDFENNTTRTTLETTVEQQINTGNTFDGKFGGVSTTTSR